MSCEEVDFTFPMIADVYYASTEQGPYGGVVKTWFKNKTVVGNFTYLGPNTKEEVKPNIDIVLASTLLGRVKSDVRISPSGLMHNITNIVITNIRDCNENQFYIETSGARAGSPTIFEVATQQPFVNPFGKTEHYRLVLRRSENQGEL
jgi:hypothetical protein